MIELFIYWKKCKIIFNILIDIEIIISTPKILIIISKLKNAILAITRVLPLLSCRGQKANQTVPPTISQHPLTQVRGNVGPSM